MRKRDKEKVREDFNQIVREARNRQDAFRLFVLSKLNYRKMIADYLLQELSAEKEQRKAYVAINYLVCSDNAMATALNVSAASVTKIRQRLGLKRSPNHFYLLEVKSERTRGITGSTDAYGNPLREKKQRKHGWSGATNAFGDPIDKYGVLLPRKV